MMPLPPLRFARAVVGATLAVALALFVALRSANAVAAEALLGFGNELMQWTKVHAHSGPRTLSVNGIELHLLTISTALSVRETVDHLREVCRQRGGIQVPEKLVRSKHSGGTSVPPLVDGTFARVGE